MLRGLQPELKAISLSFYQEDDKYKLLPRSNNCVVIRNKVWKVKGASLTSQPLSRKWDASLCQSGTIGHCGVEITNPLNVKQDSNYIRSPSTPPRVLREDKKKNLPLPTLVIDWVVPWVAEIWLGQTFCEYVGDVLLGRDILDLDLFIFYALADEVVSICFIHT